VSNLSEVFPKVISFMTFRRLTMVGKHKTQGTENIQSSSCTSDEETLVNEFTPDFYRSIGR